MKKICVVGIGYIGLPICSIYANGGYDVLGVDINEDVVELINKGEIHFEEIGLSKLVRDLVTQGKFRASLEIEPADAFIIAVPTPTYEDNTVNLEYLIAAIRSIIPFIQKRNLIIIESTIPPRTIEDIIAPILLENDIDPSEDIYLAHCPERVMPGRILTEIIENSRVVGGYTNKASQKVADLYRTVVNGEVIETKSLTAEMTKLTENIYRDVNIALANELAKISSCLEIDVLDVIRIANRHPRVNILNPGPGVGGHCIAVDPYFVVKKVPELSKLISNAREINSSMPLFVVNNISKMVDKGGKVAIFGITYKGNIEDVRNSPAIEIINLLNSNEYTTTVYDPHVKQEQVNFKLYGFEEAIENADCILVLTDHEEFKLLDENKLRYKMKTPVIFDTKNCVRVVDPSVRYYNFNSLYKIGKEKPKVLI